MFLLIRKVIFALSSILPLIWSSALQNTSSIHRLEDGELTDFYEMGWMCNLIYLCSKHMTLQFDMVLVFLTIL